MTTADEMLRLQWNDFKENVKSAFEHKLVLIASSPFFQNILRKNKHPHPLIYRRGVRSVNLSAMVDFLYFGEANVHQESLDIFLQLRRPG